MRITASNGGLFAALIVTQVRACRSHMDYGTHSH